MAAQDLRNDIHTDMLFLPWDDVFENSLDHTGLEQTAPGRRGRPCKGQRERFRKLMLRMKDTYDKDPASFRVNASELPGWIQADPKTLAKVYAELEAHAQERKFLNKPELMTSVDTQSFENNQAYVCKETGITRTLAQYCHTLPVPPGMDAIDVAPKKLPDAIFHALGTKLYDVNLYPQYVLPSSLYPEDRSYPLQASAQWLDARSSIKPAIINDPVGRDEQKVRKQWMNRHFDNFDMMNTHALPWTFSA